MATVALLVPLAVLIGAGPAQAIASPCSPVSYVYDYSSNSAPIECISSVCGYGQEMREGNGGRITMHCWYDGAWYTGNYSSNRWFEVYPPGLPGLWLIHSSYVYNQVSVGHC